MEQALSHSWAEKDHAHSQQSVREELPEPEKTVDALAESHSLNKSPNDNNQHWINYERAAKQHDEEFWERQNGKLDALLIFAGLFSAINTAFIIDMKRELRPDPLDTTNALLKLAIRTMNATAFQGEELSLPVFTGPQNLTLGIHGLAYASLATSLLSAFGIVLCKQWLYHFKTSRIGRGTIDDRCKYRQVKIDGMNARHFEMLCNRLPFLLIFSLLLFIIALSANLFTLKNGKVLSGLVLGITGFGAFYIIIASLLFTAFPRGPFQLVTLAYIRETISRARKKESKKTFFGSSVLSSFLSDLEIIRTTPFSIDTTAATVNWIVQNSSDLAVQFDALKIAAVAEWPTFMDLSGIILTLESLHEQYRNQKDKYQNIANIIFHLSFMYSPQQLKAFTNGRLKQFTSWHELAWAAFKVQFGVEEKRDANSDPFPTSKELATLSDHLEKSVSKDPLWHTRRITRKIFVESRPMHLQTLLKSMHMQLHSRRENTALSCSLLCLIGAFKVLGITFICPTQATEVSLVKHSAQRGLLINKYLLSLLGALGEEMALSNDRTSADDKLQHELEDSAFEIICVSLPEVLRYTYYADNFFKHVVTCLNGSEEEVDVDLAERLYRLARYSLDVAITLTCIHKRFSRKEDLIWNIDAMEVNCIDDLSEVALIRYIGCLTSPIEVRYHDAVINCLLLAYKVKLINKTTHSIEYLGHLVKLLDYFKHASTFNREVLLAIHKGLCVVEGFTSRSPEEKDKINQVLEMIHQALPETQDQPSLS